MKRRLFILALPPLFLSLALSAHAKTEKYALIVANNEGHDGKRILRYAETDAGKMHRVLTDLGGFEPKNTILLLGADAAQVSRAMHNLEQRVAKEKRRGTSTLLVFYYSGHAEGDLLELGKSSLEFIKVKKYLEKSKADVRLGFIDSCRSGRLISDKGGTIGPTFDIQVGDEITSSGFAIMTSSAADEVSQETAEFRGGYFTHYLVSALHGAGDDSKDGQVTLDEAYRYAYKRTTARTSTTIDGSQHPMYQFQLKGKGDVVITWPERAHSSLVINSLGPGRLVLLDPDAQSIVAEVELGSGKRSEFGINSGEYRVYHIGAKGRVRSTEINARKGRSVELASSDFIDEKLRRDVTRGGLFLKSENPWSHHIGLGGLWRRWPVDSSLSAFGAAVHYRLLFEGGFQPVLRLLWSSKPTLGEATRYNDFGGQLGAGYALKLKPFLLRVELLAGFEILTQTTQDKHKHLTSGYSYLGLAGLEVPVGPAFYVGLNGGLGGRVFREEGAGIAHRLDLQVLVTTGMTLGN